MNDGRWIRVDGEDGETIAVVCSRDERGMETLISECGRRLLRRGPDSFVDEVSGMQYRERARDVLRDPPENGPYEVAVHERAGYIELVIRGDFRHSSAVQGAWATALESISGRPARRVLVVREAGRIATDTDKLDQLRRVFGTVRGDERVAVVLAGAIGGEMLIALARLHGLQLAIFSDREAATRWLLA